MAIRVAIAGAGGRMGQALIEAVLGDASLVLAAALDVPASPAVGADAGQRIGHATGVVVRSDVDAAVRAADVLIDFTRPEGTLAHLDACARHGTGAVVGTTGLSDAQRARVAALAERVPIVLAPNMSVGVNVVLKLLDVAGHALAEGFDVEIVETHHRMKVDAPSGTALKMGEVVAAAQKKALDDVAAYDRNGERRAGSIGFASLRGGDIVGDHTVLFAGNGERIEITHRSSSRATYAEGSLRAARFVLGKKTGLFGMDEVLGLAGTR
jgi:4-hydroxy-tetrahydrodipicolinate reductase